MVISMVNVMVWWADVGLKILPLVALAPARRRESELKPPAAASKLRSRVPMQKVLPGRWAQVRSTRHPEPDNWPSCHILTLPKPSGDLQCRVLLEPA